MHIAFRRAPRRALAFLLAVSAPAAALPFATSTPPAAAVEMPPAPASVPQPGDELVHLRTANSKTFATDTLKDFRTKVFSGPVHFLDAQGTWAEIDSRLVAAGPGRLRNAGNAFTVDVAHAQDDPALGRLVLDAGHSVAFRALDALPGSGTVEHNRITYRSVWPGVDVRLSSQPGGLKEDLILASRLAPHVYVFPLVLQGLTAEIEVATGDVLYRDATGAVRARTPHGWMEDANVDPRVGDGARSDDVTYALVPLPGGVTALQVTLSRQWLDAPERVYPVTVDPTLHPQNTQSDDTYVQQPYNNNYSGDYQLKGGTFNGGADKARSFLHFHGLDLAGLNGKDINAATIWLYNFHSFSCNHRPMRIHRIVDNWDANTYRTFPGANFGEMIDEQNFAKGYSGCGADWQGFNAQAATHNWTHGTWANQGVMVVSPNENDSYGWKKFYAWNQGGDAPGAPTPHLDVHWSWPNRDPFGSYDSLGAEPGRVRVGGWAIDPDTTAAINVHAYIDGAYAGSLTANGYRPDVGAAYPGYGDYHGFDGFFNAAAGTRNVCLYAINYTSGNNPSLGCRSVSVPNPDTNGPPPPTVSSGTHPDPASWYSQRILEASWTVPYDPSGVTGYSVRVDQNAGTLPPASANTNATTYRYTTDRDGQWYIHVRAVDGLGNWGTTAAHFSFRVDTTNPTAPATVASTSHATGVPSVNRNIDVNWTAGSDQHSGVSRYAYTFNDSETTAVNPATAPTTASTSARSSALPDGTYWVHVRTIDNAVNAPSPCTTAGPDGGGYRCTGTPYQWGDMLASTYQPLADDEVSPAIPLSFPFPWYGQAKTSVHIGSNGLVCFDSAGCSSWNPPQIPNTGTPNSLAACMWEDLNPAAGGTVRYKDNGSTFLVEYNNVPHYYYTGNVNTFQIQLFADGTVRCMYFNVTSDGDGTPTAAGIEGPGGTTGLRYRHAEFAHYETGIAFVPNLIEGNAGVDKAYGPFVIDATGPGTPTIRSATHPEATWTPSRTATFAWDPPADASALAGYRVKFDTNPLTDPEEGDSATTTPTWTEPNITPDGIHWLHVRAKDAAGNLGGTDHYEVRVDATAPTAPVVSSDTHVEPSRWYPTRTARFTLTGDDTSGVTEFSYERNQLATFEVDTVAETSQRTITLDDVPDGQWYFHVRAKNGAGLWSTETTTFGFKVDATAPTIPGTVTSSTHNTVDPTNQRVVKVAWEPPGTDAMSGVAGYSFDFNNSETARPDNQPDTTDGSAISGTLADGTWWFHVVTVDHAGNVSDDRTFGPVTIATDAPPVAETDTQRFLGLWVPRVRSDTFGEAWIADEAYSQEILDEGFHALTEEQKQYLAGRLLTAAKAASGDMDDATTEENAELRRLLYDFVWDKQHLRNIPNLTAATAPVHETLDAVEDLTPAPVAAAFTEKRTQFEPLVRPQPTTPATVLKAVAPAIPVIPGVTTVPVPSALSQPTTDAIRAVEEGLRDTQPQVQAMVDKVAADTGVRPVFDAVFPTLAAALPVSPFYTLCWKSATAEGCREANVVNTAASVDVTGDGTFDVQATFGAALDPTAPLGSVPFQYVLERLPVSETAGSTLAAHVWVQYDVNLTSRRLLLGFDGFARGDGLSTKTTLVYALKDLAAFQLGDLSARYSITHVGQRPAWALTAGLRTPAQEQEDPLDASLRMTPVPTSVAGDIDAVRTQEANATTRRLRVTLDATTSFTLDGIVNSSRRSADEDSHARVLIDRLSTANALEVVQTTGGPVTTTDVHATSSASIGRASLARTVRVGDEVRAASLDLRDIPTDVRYTANESGGRNDVAYDADAVLSRFALALTRDRAGERQEATVVRGEGVPDWVRLGYGTAVNPDDDRMFLEYTASGTMTALDAMVYDRAARIALAASAAGLAPVISGSVEPSAGKVSLVADAPIGALTGTFSRNEGGVHQPPAEHATLVIEGSEVGASIDVRGLHTLRGTFDAVTTAEVGVSPGGQRLVVAGRVDETFAVADLGDVASSVVATLDRNELHAHLSASRRMANASVYAGRRPGGPTFELTLADIPSEVDIDGSMGATAELRYTGNATLGSVRGMLTTDGTVGDGSGTTLTASLAQVPTTVTIIGRPAEREVHVTTSAPLGTAEITFSRNGGRAEVPAGEHATMNVAGEASAGSVRLTGLSSVDIDFDTAGTSTGDIKVSPGGQPFLVSASLDNTRIFGRITNLPSHVKVVVEGTSRVRYEASARIQSVEIYKATSGEGASTLWASAKDVPTLMELRGTLAPRYHIEYTADARLGELRGTFSPDHMTGPPPSGSGRYGSVTARDLPAWATLDADTRNGTMHWLASSPITSLEVDVRALPDVAPDGVLFARATGVPAHLQASRTKTSVSARSFDSPVGRLEVGFAKASGDPESSVGDHIRFRGSETEDRFNVSVEATDVTHFWYDNAGKATRIHSEVDLHGRPLAVDAELLGPAPGTPEDQDPGDEFARRVVGTVTSLPTDLSVTAAEKVVVFSADRPFGAQLTADYGWVAALRNTPLPVWRHGVSVTDGACGTADGCRPVTESTCKNEPERQQCYGFKIRYDHEGMGTRIEALTEAKTVKVTDVRPSVGPLDVEVRLELRHSGSSASIADVRQEGIGVGTDLEFRMTEVKGADDKPIETRIVTAHSADLGKLSGSLEQPGKVIAGKENDTFRLLDPRVQFTVSNVPASLDLLVKHGNPSGAVVSVSAPVTYVVAFLTADVDVRSGSTWTREAAPGTGLVVLSDVPATAAGTPVTLDVVRLPEPERTDQGQRNPKANPLADVKMTDCEGTEITPPEDGETKPAEKPGEEKKGLGPPQVTYSSPTGTVDGLVDVELPIVRVADEKFGLVNASLDRITFGFVNLGKSVQVLPALDNRSVQIRSLEGNTGDLWFAVDFRVKTECRRLSLRKAFEATVHNDTKVTLAKLEADAQYDIDATFRRVQVRLSDVRDMTLRAGTLYLAYGVDGDYGQFRLTAPDVHLDSDTWAKATLKRWWGWLPPWARGSLELRGTYNHLWSRTGSFDRLTKTSGCLTLQLGFISVGHGYVFTRPGPEKLQKDGVTIDGRATNGERRVFTFLDPGPDAPGANFQWVLDIAAATFGSPYPTGGAVGIGDFGTGGC